MFTVLSLIAFVWLFKLHMIVFLRGNPGWDYRNLQLPMQASAVPAQLPKYPSFLEEALWKGGLRSIRGTGELQGVGLFLHYASGKILPFNYGIAQNTWPERIFGDQLEMHEAAFVKILQHTLKRRREGIKFMLPSWLSLPSHIEWRSIDYTTYPPGEELQEISVWSLVVYVDRDRPPIIVGARLLRKITVKP